jgi:hypothetical protein
MKMFSLRFLDIWCTKYISMEAQCHFFLRNTAAEILQNERLLGLISAIFYLKRATEQSVHSVT